MTIDARSDEAAGTVRVESLTRDFATPTGSLRAIDGVSFEVASGTTLAVVGPSGCGKSTLLGLLGGLDTPTTGRVVVGGRPISELDDRCRTAARRTTFGYVFQSGNLVPYCTVLENVGLRLAMTGGVGGEDRCVELLGEVGLGDHLHKLPDQLSRGQRQRAVVVAALIHSPAVILADEPTGSLDEDSATGLIDLLLRVQRDSGATLVVVTHDRSIACRMDRTITFHHGRVVADSEADPEGTTATATATAAGTEARSGRDH